MKKRLYTAAVFAAIVLASCSSTRPAQRQYDDQSYDNRSSYDNQEDYNNTRYDQRDAITYQEFYNELDPYGQWMDNPEFGRVWSPRQSGFRPYYSDGHWAYTNYGWTWVSDYNWGWATFHYGRWYYDNFNGWLWVPGYQWAPAWVDWRRNNDYYGWAPMCPQSRNGRYFQPGYDQWAFVPQQYIYRSDLGNYYVNSQNNSTIINNTTVINNTRIIKNGGTYQQGPSLGEVEKVSNAKIRTFGIKQSATPGNTKIENGELQIYRPEMKRFNKMSANKNTQPGNEVIRNTNAGENNGVRKIPVYTPSGNDNNVNVRGGLKRKRPMESTDESLSGNNQQPDAAPLPRRNKIRILDNNEGSTNQPSNSYPGNTRNKISRDDPANQNSSPAPQRIFRPSPNPPAEKPANVYEKRQEIQPQNNNTNPTGGGFRKTPIGR